MIPQPSHGMYRDLVAGGGLGLLCDYLGIAIGLGSLAMQTNANNDRLHPFLRITHRYSGI